MNSLDYLKFLAPQWHDLMFKFDIKFSRHFRRVAGSLYSLLARRWPQATFEHFTKPVLEPFLSNDNVTAAQFYETLTRIHAIFVESTDPNWLTISQLPVEMIALLFQVYERVYTLVAAIETRTQLEDIIKLYCRMKPNADLPKFLADQLIDGLMKQKFQFHFGMYNDECATNDKDFVLITRKLEENLNPENITIEEVGFFEQNFFENLNLTHIDVSYSNI